MLADALLFKTKRISAHRHQLFSVQYRKPLPYDQRSKSSTSPSEPQR